MAPETLVESDQKFTEKSDVWSFGVTMWEIYDGETRKPYDNYEENEVREIILKEKTLEISNKKCHRILKVLLEQCWKKPIERPTFQEIILTLENYKIEKVFKARLVQGNLLKNVLESLKDLRNEAIWDCSDTGIQIQTKDKSNLYRASMILRADGFNKFRCDFQHRMRIKLSEMSEILKCAATNDIITIKAQEQAEMVTFMFESTNQEKMADYEMKLMNLDEEHLSIPETDYAAVIKMPSAELQRVINALSQFSESVVISCTKEDVQFSVAGDISVVNIKVAQTANVNKEEKAVSIEIQRPVSMTLACQYLNMFTKASYLASQVSLSMSPEVCLVVEYKIGDIGHICYYLTPKI